MGYRTARADPHFLISAPLSVISSLQGIWHRSEGILEQEFGLTSTLPTSNARSQNEAVFRRNVIMGFPIPE